MSEVRRGYKQTEVGVIPEDWDTVRLTSIAKLESGHTPSRHFPEYWKGDVPWISLHDTDNLDVAEIQNTAQTIGTLGLEHSSARLLPKGTVVFSRTATVGKCTVMGREMATSQDFANYVCGPRVHNHYLRHLFGFMKPDWKRLLAGSTINTIYMPAFETLRVLLPSEVREQEAIADALSDADGLIESLEQLLTKKRQIKQGAMQELLTGKRRLPGFSEKWRTGFLTDVIAALEAGVSVNSSEDDSGTAGDCSGILKTSSVVGGRFLPFECKTILPRDRQRARLNPKLDTILISRMNTPDLVGECGYVERDYPELFVPDRLWLTRFNSTAKISARWLAYMLSSPEQKARIKAAATGTSGSMKNLSKPAFLSLTLDFPSRKEQTAIASVLSDMEADTAVFETKIAKAHQLKQGMMQELLTGRTRLV